MSATAAVTPKKPLARIRKLIREIDESIPVYKPVSRLSLQIVIHRLTESLPAETRDRLLSSSNSFAPRKPK